MQQSSALCGPEDDCHMQWFVHSLKAEALQGKRFANEAVLGGAFAGTCGTTTTVGCTAGWATARRLTTKEAVRNSMRTQLRGKIPAPCPSYTRFEFTSRPEFFSTSAAKRKPWGDVSVVALPNKSLQPTAYSVRSAPGCSGG
jgi:hypothetical protein